MARSGLTNALNPSLSPHIITSDLTNQNHFIVALSLNAVGNIASVSSLCQLLLRVKVHRIVC